MTYTITYFQARGRAEAARLIAAEGNVALKNKFVDFQTFGATKSSLPFAQLPVLESDDGSIVLAQSIAICRFLARKANLVPSNLEKYKIIFIQFNNYVVLHWQTCMWMVLPTQELPCMLLCFHKTRLPR